MASELFPLSYFTSSIVHVNGSVSQDKVSLHKQKMVFLCIHKYQEVAVSYLEQATIVRLKYHCIVSPIVLSVPGLPTNAKCKLNLHREPG